MKAYSLDLRQRRFVFVDETAANTAMTRRYGRAPRGERAHDALCFDAYAERVLAPRRRPGDVVVLDNLTAHRASRIEEAAQGRGAQVLWPAPYSPDFGPIEQCWSKIKAYLRGAQARTEDELNQAWAQAIGLVTKADIRGWFKHCGYSLARE